MDAYMVKCPVCLVGKLNILSDQLNIPHFGEVVISTLICPSCGYRTTDILPMDTKVPKRFTVLIDDPAKTDLRVVRSGTSTVRIPEIGVRIDPGLFSDGYITNIEGILRRVRDILHQLIDDMDLHPDTENIEEKRAQALEIDQTLGNFIDGSIPVGGSLTIIIEDPMGNSAILSSVEGLIVEEVLSDEEIGSLLGSRTEKDIITNL